MASGLWCEKMMMMMMMMMKKKKKKTKEQEEGRGILGAVGRSRFLSEWRGIRTDYGIPCAGKMGGDAGLFCVAAPHQFQYFPPNNDIK